MVGGSRPLWRSSTETQSVDEQIRAIQEYVYSKYVEPGDHGALDEEGAVRLLDTYYSDPSRLDDAECFFPGVLWFELGFEPP